MPYIKPIPHTLTSFWNVTMHVSLIF
uniref:Uncharacterized protein n=1 Tax=Anguilla anguilla TaxID=7936 RepID=A0A0E9U9S6_ANGAN